jgi:phosphate transport system substrate-binding protein
VNWSQLGPANEDCGSDEIMRISRQNNSGTYYYFRDAVVGKQREFKLGSMDLSGSKEVVETIKETPCAIGYSGMAYANEHVKMLSISKDGSDPVTPSKATAADGSYPIARPLLLYTSGEPTGALKDYLEWVLSPAGQKIVDEIGYVPINPTE